MSPLPRRSFLSGLVSLPLIGGGVTLIGRPTAAAVQVTHDFMHAYKNWLHMEHRMISRELAMYDTEMGRWIERSSFPSGLPADSWHLQWERPGARGPAGWIDAPQPSTRAAVVLSAAGVPLTGRLP